MTEPAVVVDRVSKRFRRYHVRNQSLKSSLFRGGRGRYDEFWVLNDVSFDVPKGSTFGLIGSNGSGKSTLLKCMARILRPDRGEIRTEGKVSALLELGAGFHPELSGRENVYLNGAVLGLRRREIDARFGEIVSFAGKQIEGAIDQPIKTYSSGMYVRLGFSIAVNVDPDVLLVDEVLAVGDEQFQRRCVERFDRLAADGRTVIVVSHALPTVAAMCDEVAWLDQGRLALVGPPQAVIDSYVGRLDFGEALSVERPDRAAVRITEVSLEGGTGDPPEVPSGSAAVLRVRYVADEAVPPPVVSFTIHTPDGTLVANPSTPAEDLPERVEGEGWADLEIPRLMLVPGPYFLGAALLDPAGGHAIDKRLRLVRFEVIGGEPGESRGIAALNGRWGGPLFGSARTAGDSAARGGR